MKSYSIPEFLRPFDCPNLIRLGRNYDGGYIVNKHDVTKAKCLLSFGISHDWSFEREFSKFNNNKISAFDGSVSVGSIWRHSWKNIFRFDRLDILIDAWRTIFFIHRFFDAKLRVFESKFVGLQSAEFQIALSDAIKNEGDSSIFIKMDIEGSEYELLNVLLQNAQSVEGLAIEFHDVANNLQLIKEFIQSYPLTLVHTHINNCGPPEINNLPQMIELSFSRNQQKKRRVAFLPNKLDMSNSPKLALPNINFLNS